MESNRQLPNYRQIADLLARLDEHTRGDVVGMAIAWVDGTTIFTRAATDIDQHWLAAVAATLLGISQCVAGELQLGDIDEVIIKTHRGVLMLFCIGDYMLMVIRLRQEANLGLVSLESREVVTELQGLL